MIICRGEQRREASTLVNPLG
ncbi:MAG: hypothetical protein RLZZ499_2397, partial [Cyanobacteriota bacterium]